MKASLSGKIILIHMAVWLSYLFLLLLFYSESRDFDISLYRSLFIVCVQAIIFYLNLYYLLPILMEKKKYILYILFLLALIVVFVWLFDYVMHYFISDDIKSFIDQKDRSKLPEEYINKRFLNRGKSIDCSPRTRILHGRFLLNGFFVFISLFISTIYYNMVVNRKREKEAVQLQNQMLEAETKMLKWQINPHFLFNTLNNIYSMSQMKSDKTPNAIHRLSQMLRYVIYDCNDNFVKLEQEISYIRSYINLQMLKDENMQNVKFDLQVGNPYLKIAPMLLISFVENSFKHSNIEDTENSWINIKLTTIENKLNFTIKNSIPEQTFAKDKSGGVGMENVKKRLQLLYPNKHYLKLTQEKNVYSVELMLELNEN